MNVAVPFLLGLLATISVARAVRLTVAGLAGRRGRLRARHLVDPPRGASRVVPLARLRDVVERVAGRDDEVWPAWLEAAGRSARAGASLRGSLRDATDSFRSTAIGPHLVRFARVLDGGGPIEHAVEQLRARDGSTDDALVGRALTLAVRTGGPAAVVLDAVASTLRERSALTREVRALSTQARASALVMVVSPFAFALLAGGADPRVLTFLGSGPGLVCLGAGVALDALGAWWMARIVRGAA